MSGIMQTPKNEEMTGTVTTQTFGSVTTTFAGDKLDTVTFAAELGPLSVKDLNEIDAWKKNCCVDARTIRRSGGSHSAIKAAWTAVGRRIVKADGPDVVRKDPLEQDIDFQEMVKRMIPVVSTFRTISNVLKDVVEDPYAPKHEVLEKAGACTLLLWAYYEVNLALMEKYHDLRQREPTSTTTTRITSDESGSTVTEVTTKVTFVPTLSLPITMDAYADLIADLDLSFLEGDKIRTDGVDSYTIEELQGMQKYLPSLIRIGAHITAKTLNDVQEIEGNVPELQSIRGSVHQLTVLLANFRYSVKGFSGAW